MKKLILTAALLVGCHAPKPQGFWLRHQHAIGCDDSNAKAESHRLSLISPNGVVFTTWLENSPKCSVWNTNTYWNLRVSWLTYEAYDLLDLTESK